MVVIALPKRYILSEIIFIGFFVMSGLKVNLNVAIGAVVNNCMYLTFFMADGGRK